MRHELAAALIWLGTHARIPRKKAPKASVLCEDGLVPEANADVVFGRINHSGSKLSEKEIALREKLGRGDVHDAAMLLHLELGARPLSGNDVPLGDTPRKE